MQTSNVLLFKYLIIVKPNYDIYRSKHSGDEGYAEWRRTAQEIAARRSVDDKLLLEIVAGYLYDSIGPSNNVGMAESLILYSLQRSAEHENSSVLKLRNIGEKCIRKTRIWIDFYAKYEYYL